MAELNEHVAYLSQEIGPRPAGTEEEQRAALYISEQFSAEAGLTTAMEDFQCNPDSSLPRTLCSGVAVLVTLVATIVGALAVPAIWQEQPAPPQSSPPASPTQLHHCTAFEEASCRDCTGSLP